MASSSPRLVVIAASAGGLQPIIDVLAPLPADFPAAIAIVSHRGAGEPDELIRILAKRTGLRVQHAVTGGVLEAGVVYVCPPGVHMTAEHSLHLSEGPRIDFVRPNADLMFTSVARTYGDRAIGIVLSGLGRDGALGSLAIAQAGGCVLAQDSKTCLFDDMPTSALKVGAAEPMRPAMIGLELGRLVYGHGWQPRPAPTSTIDVVLADDHQIVLEGLRVLLESEADVRVVAGAATGEAAIKAAGELAPHVVVMDIRMPGIDGIESTRQILANNPQVGVIALSAENDPVLIGRMLRAGAAGYLTKHRAFDELVRAIRTVIDGRTYLSPEIARLVAAGTIAAPVPPGHRS